MQFVIYSSLVLSRLPFAPFLLSPLLAAPCLALSASAAVASWFATTAILFPLPHRPHCIACRRPSAAFSKATDDSLEEPLAFRCEFRHRDGSRHEGHSRTRRWSHAPKAPSPLLCWPFWSCPALPSLLPVACLNQELRRRQPRHAAFSARSATQAHTTREHKTRQGRVRGSS